jgi:3-oxoacyl-[acyl-carrier protein] reductase/pteridine reductase
MNASARPLEGKAVLVTGGARRIGRAIALRLAEAGARVAITYRNSAEEAEKTRKEIEALGSQGLAVCCDLRQEESVRAAVQQAAGQLGGLDLLVNNAGLFDRSPFETLTIEAWDAVFETNARGPFLTSREALPWLKQTQGRIVNVGSLGGERAWATHAHYCASKAALHMLTQTMAKALAPEVAVNGVAPGWIEIAEVDPTEAAHFAGLTPMRRNGRPEEVAEAVLFFASGPKYITGQILGVDGGLGL